MITSKDRKGTRGIQVDRYKYLVWVPGNCASVRLALQLASDAAVLKVQQHITHTQYSFCSTFRNLVHFWFQTGSKAVLSEASEVPFW